MEAWIKSIGNISPQNTLDPQNFLSEPVVHDSDYLKCIEPEYKEFLNPALARRMGRIIKMGVAAAKICLRNSGIDVPDAIITGTGLGCIEDTERFLSTINENQEKLLPPTSFIQSTHNTVSAQIALELKCNNYNLAYVHRGFSFESALLDSLMLMTEGSAKNVLLGGIDEITPNSYQITRRLGHWKNEKINNLELIKHKTKGSIAGEGSTFFLLTNQNEPGCYARVGSVGYLCKPGNTVQIGAEITDFINLAGLKISDIDLVLLGNNGDLKFDYIYDEVRNNYFDHTLHCYYKHLCGEYFTSTAFALWLAANILKKQSIPELIKINNEKPERIKNILIYNHYRNIDHSFILVSIC
jgi:3-oxoacyl-[acyl-carrier-protein] synthase II